MSTVIEVKYSIENDMKEKHNSIEITFTVPTMKVNHPNFAYVEESVTYMYHIGHDEDPNMIIESFKDLLDSSSANDATHIFTESKRL